MEEGAAAEPSGSPMSVYQSTDEENGDSHTEGSYQAQYVENPDTDPDLRVSCKLGFPDDTSSDKQREQIKEDRKEEGYEKWKQHFFRFVIENPQLFPVLQFCPGQNLAPSSASSVNVNKCRLDSITEQAPCSLHMPMGRRGTIIEVAKGIVYPGRIFHNIAIPPQYAKVSVLEVVNWEYNDLELDYPLPDEGIKTLGNAVHKFIFWHRQISF